jgi:hypothetical protein
MNFFGERKDASSFIVVRFMSFAIFLNLRPMLLEDANLKQKS